MDVPVLADQQEPTYNSSMQTDDVVLKIYRFRCVIVMNGERESRKSELAAQSDDIYIYIYKLVLTPAWWLTDSRSNYFWCEIWE